MDPTARQIARPAATHRKTFSQYEPVPGPEVAGRVGWARPDGARRPS
jgi:hypothetical protein